MKPIWQDTKGYVWYGEGDDAVEIEHFIGRLSYHDACEMRERTDHLEKIGVPVNSRTMVWYSDWYPSYLWAGSPYLWLLKRPCDIYEGNGVLLFIVGREPINKDASLINIKVWTGKNFYKFALIEEWNDNFYHILRNLGYEIADAGQEEYLGVCYSTYEGVVRLLEKYNVPEDEP